MFILKSTHKRIVGELEDKIYHLEEKVEQRINKLYELHFEDNTVVKCVAYQTNLDDEKRVFSLEAYDAAGAIRTVYLTTKMPTWFKADLLPSDTELKPGVQP